MLKMATS